VAADDNFDTQMLISRLLTLILNTQSDGFQCLNIRRLVIKKIRQKIRNYTPTLKR